MIIEQEETKNATRNSCVLCAPLGASVVFRGIEGGLPLLHGSQGCSTYIRRYLISHFKEPVDIASSNFSEASTIFGGGNNLKAALSNLLKQYNPKFIGIASTCLTETIGEDVESILREYRQENVGMALPELVYASTPSYRGTHIDGFRIAVKAVVEQLCRSKKRGKKLNIFPGFVSPADLRHLREILNDFRLSYTMLPDYADSLDSPAWDKYQLIPSGGTLLREIKTMGGAEFSVELGKFAGGEKTGADFLEGRFKVKNYRCGLPVGINQTDAFFRLLSALSSRVIPEKYLRERGRLIDSYFDGHKYLFGKKAVIYGPAELVAGITSLLTEVGIVPVLCASGGGERLKERITAIVAGKTEVPRILENTDFSQIEEETIALHPDLLIGNSKGYGLARKLAIPLIRVGFPVHDRFGAQRNLLLGYKGTQQLLDRLINAIIEKYQDSATGGYSYI
jgi:nitrogenase molybdenum-iron protein NifN